MSVIEEKPNEILNESIHHKWLHDDSFENLYDFNKFINWLSGEFTLYQQDEFHGLTVFIPNGWFSIEQLSLNKNVIEFRIEVKSKCFKSGVKIFNQVKLILKHFKSKVI
ncbi:hypothetical protein Q4Q35_04120 [Flavivirga aquimarina]|uniref:Uncharacterized protein n=1 Tax=Flavivirga aquimarina TaxID=2027862 RepID=A0ABT8W7B5_9FLAO|nr:hypothetical protein [Flavivirga aquimarina]MDO5968985.1 hypothetical protein [Flavivirga aquimarina]